MILNSRWQASSEQFAVRINTTNEEISGLLKNSIVVEPGTRAYVFQEGQAIGEIPPSEYTVKSFTEKLMFWRKGQTTVILVRSDIQAFEVPECDCLTSDGLVLAAKARCAVQIADIGKFLLNLLGPRDTFSVSEIRERATTLLQQALWYAIGSRSLQQVNSPAIAHELSKQIEDGINLSFQRYGLKFVEVEMISTRSGEFGEVLKSNAQLKLANLKDQGETAKIQADLNTIQQRVPVREQLRDAVQSDKMDKIRTKEEMSQFLLEINKGKLLRKEELDVLVEEFDKRKEDRESLCDHLTAVIDLNREQEIEQLRESVSHQIKLQGLRSEIKLAELAGEKANLEWKQELQREVDSANHLNARRKTDLQAKWDRIREQQRQRQDAGWEDLVHRQKVETLRQDVEVAEQQRQKRVALLEQETVTELDRQKIEMERRRKEWELEVAEKESMSQLDRLQRVQEMNLQMQERERRTRLDLEELKADKSHQRELDRMEAMGKLGTEALIASANLDNAALLADLNKHKSSEQSKRHEAEISNKDQLNEERLKMYEKLSDVERAKADAVTAAFREAMQGQQATVQQMISGLAQANTPPGMTPSGMTPPPMQAPPAMQPMGAVWYVDINGQQSGPHDLAALQNLVAQGQVNATTQVWRQGMATWVAASQVPELNAVLGATPP